MLAFVNIVYGVAFIYITTSIATNTRLVSIVGVVGKDYITPENDCKNTFRFKLHKVGPDISPPSGVVRFFSKTTLFWLNLTQEPSFFKVSFLVLIIIPLYLDFFFYSIFRLR